MPNLVTQSRRSYFVHTCITIGKSLGYWGSIGKLAFFFLVFISKEVDSSQMLTLDGVSIFFSKKQKTDASPKLQQCPSREASSYSLPFSIE